MEEETLVKRAQNGDKEAFVTLMDQYKVPMYRLALAIVRTKVESEDVLSETIIKAYEKLRTLREPRFFKTWLMRIVINEANQALRNRKRIVQLTEWNKEQQIQALTTNIEMEELIQELPEEMRVVIVLFYFEQWTIKEMSELLKLPEGTVKNRLHRARKKLIPLLKNEEMRVKSK